jgi:AAA domain (dynein-related subfamily)
VQPVRTVTPAALPEVLLSVAVVRPVFLWGAPGIGKSSMVRQFAASLGLDCVSLLGTQLAPEELIGVSQIVDGRSRFCPPEQIARDRPYCLFLDELNAASPDVQKAFLLADPGPQDRVVRAPGRLGRHQCRDRATDQALARPMASALVNRLVHIHLSASATDWLAWAVTNGIRPGSSRCARARECAALGPGDQAARTHAGRDGRGFCCTPHCATTGAPTAGTRTCGTSPVTS